MKLLTIQVGQPKPMEWKGKRLVTAILKSPVDGPVKVRRLGLEGDAQGDLTVHGGVDKAVYAYGADAYGWWREELGDSALPYGAFGENLDFETLDEKAIGVGDVYALGSARLQVAEPRFPCATLGTKFRDMGILKTFMKSGRPGIYFRVVAEGEIRRGETLTLVTRDPAGVSLHEMFELRHDHQATPERIQKLLSVKSLSAPWREKFHGRLATQTSVKD